MAYTQNTPLPTQTKAFTQPLIEANFQFLQTGLGTEHAFFPGTDGSTMNHLQASMPNIAVEPTAAPAFSNGMYYVSNNNARYITGGGTVCKLTEGTAAQNGSQWIGRVVIQWGVVTGISTDDDENTTGIVTFSQTLTSNPYVVIVSPVLPASPGGTWAVGARSYTTTGFTWITRGSSALTAINWVAIGVA
jgi:hypothetical protein